MAYTKEKYVRLSIAVPVELNEKLDNLSSKMHVSKTALVIQMIESNIDIFSAFWDSMKNPIVMKTLSAIAKRQGNNEMVNTIENLNDNIQNNTQEFQDADKLISELSNKK